MLFFAWWRKLYCSVRRRSSPQVQSDENPHTTGSGAEMIRSGEELSNACLVQENERLRQRVRELEGERQSLAALRAECAAYRHVLSGWAQGQFTQAELRRLVQEEDEE